MAGQPELPRESARGLVVAYAFAPYADTSAVAACKRVVARGEPVDVISNAMDSLRGRDDSLAELVAPVVRRHETVRTQTMFAGWSSILSFVRAGQRTLRRWGEQPGGTPYTWVYSRAHFIASHMLAATVGGHPGVRWQAEMSDPLSRDALGAPRTGPVPRGPLADELGALLVARGVRMPEEATVYVWAETLAYTLADEVVFTSAGQRDYCLSYIEDDRVRRMAEDKARVEPHPTLPAGWYSRRSPDLHLAPGLVHVGYFGGFYASQDPSALLGAVSDLAPTDRARLRLHLFTTPTPELVAEVSAHGVGDVVLLRDRLPYLDFLAATRQLDVLLAIDAAPVAGRSVPHVRLSKMSDYLGSGTPLWGIVAPGSVLSQEDLAVATPLGHRTATLQALTTLARRGAAAG